MSLEQRHTPSRRPTRVFAGPSGVSAPFRVEGTRAVLPGDGSRYDDDVRRLFPSRMVEAILQHSDDLRPR